ncbi:LRR receptor-like serine/threonine-protein kinase FLS2 [Ricinus communis]|uniref:LRR receptor-like serine/threonine-protein kinase FLS2 n=1 Tax=Ricinus communis TaxID=3988 RepID=UPI00201A8815|nr:LRR receptor-like serine/threonine-protein kinase FLS2 [Ricinus communis]
MKLQILLTYFLVFILSSISTITGCYENERAALLSFKSQIMDPSNRLSSWQGHNCCNWQGIHCSGSLHVISVDLRNPKPYLPIINSNSYHVSTSTSESTALRGTISSSLFTLTRITYLDLSFNNFMYSRIPPGISNFTRLTYLNLSNAAFSDSITIQFANLTSLESLDLSCSTVVSDFSSISYDLSFELIQVGSPYGNVYSSNLSSTSLHWLQGMHNLKAAMVVQLRISGELPISQLLNLTQLSVLVLDFNPITSQIPVQLANLTSLSVIHFTGSNLQGPIPYIPQLQELHVGSTDLTIDLKSMFSNPWPRLKSLDIRHTQVKGSIPPSISNTTSLIRFVASGCLIEGVIPSSIANLSRMEILKLNINNLVGHLPPSINNMRSLQALSLIQNNLQGPIPDSICNVSSLWYLALANNNFSGKLPDCISHLPKLDVLFVTSNSLNGEVHTLTSLLRGSNPYMIGLSFNHLTLKLDKQSLPPSFQPEVLELSSCNIEGNLPNFFSNLTKLRYLSLSYNYLSGAIPPWLFNLPQLGYLDLSFNKLQGSIPPFIQLKSFFGATTLNLANNLLQGPVPSQLVNIDAINLSGNSFTGHIPEQAGLGSVRYISLSSNNLVGHIPDSFCYQKNALMVLDLSNNSLSGPLPGNLGKCIYLSVLNLAHNNFSNSVPEVLENARNLSYLDLTGNQFKGPFPSFIRRLKSLVVLQMGYNNFAGKIPGFIGDLKNLRILVLKSNFFSELIPPEINKLEKLQIMDLSDNNLFGTIPEKLEGLKTLITRPTDGELLGYVISFMYSGVELSMAYKGLIYQFDCVKTYHSGIDLSLNALTGKIPPEMTLLIGLAMLNLSHNALSGEIPSNIGDMIGLNSLDLKFNRFSGKIPDSINLLDSLGYLNLSYNNLSGKIPAGTRFDTLYGDGSAYIGNEHLCGAGNLINCNDNTSSSSEETKSVEDSIDRLLFIGVVVSGYGVGFWGYFGVLCLIKEQHRRRYWKAIEKIAFKIVKMFMQR